MYIRASVAVSVDGMIDDRSERRVILSSAEDWKEVRAARAACDAILVGAETLRRDNPALVTREEVWRRKRIAKGCHPDPIKVTVSKNGELDLQSRFFNEGSGEKIVFLGSQAKEEVCKNLSAIATVIQSDEVQMGVLEMILQLEERGIRSLFIEGGTQILTQFLGANQVDLLRVGVAPFFIGDPLAPRFVGGGQFPFHPGKRMRLNRVHKAGDMAVLEYELRDPMFARTQSPKAQRDEALLKAAILLAHRAPVSESAYSVGALIVTPGGDQFSGFSREGAPQNHAEEEAIAKALRSGVSLKGASIYSSMEPCSIRNSKPDSCCSLILQQGISRVIFATYEPDAFVNCQGTEMLRHGGTEVIVIGSLAPEALAPNEHILAKNS